MQVRLPSCPAEPCRAQPCPCRARSARGAARLCALGTHGGGQPPALLSRCCAGGCGHPRPCHPSPGHAVRRPAAAPSFLETPFFSGDPPSFGDGVPLEQPPLNLCCWISFPGAVQRLIHFPWHLPAKPVPWFLFLSRDLAGLGTGTASSTDTGSRPWGALPACPSHPNAGCP